MERRSERSSLTRGRELIVNADALYRWAQALALIATMSTTWFAIVRFMREDRLVKRQMERMGQLEKVFVDRTR